MIVDKITTDSYLTDSMEEMKKAKIRSYFDLISILRDHPDWLDELRKLILTEELINLPKKFDEFVKQYQNFIENEFKPLKQTVQKQGEDIAVLKEDVAVLKEDVAVLKEDVAVLKQDVGVLKSDVGDLKGDSFERKVRERAPSYFGKIIRKCKLISHIELANILDDALDAGIIGDDERDDALLCDIVVTGALRSDKERKVLIVAEVSVVVDKQDVERAASRTKVIEKCMGLPGIPVVIGKEHTEGALKRADELQVIVI
jgi:cell division protein FtsB